MSYPTLAEALMVAEAVTGLDLTTLSRSPRIDLLDSALHAPQASFSGQELHREFIDKTAVLDGLLLLRQMAGSAAASPAAKRIGTSSRI